MTETLTPGQKAAATRRARRQEAARTEAATINKAVTEKATATERTTYNVIDDPARGEVPNPFQAGDRVIITKHTTRKYVDEPGRIDCFGGPKGAPYAVVNLGAAAPLVPVEHLRFDPDYTSESK